LATVRLCERTAHVAPGAVRTCTCTHSPPGPSIAVTHMHAMMSCISKTEAPRFMQASHGEFYVNFAVAARPSLQPSERPADIVTLLRPPPSTLQVRQDRPVHRKPLTGPGQTVDWAWPVRADFPAHPRRRRSSTEQTAARRNLRVWAVSLQGKPRFAVRPASQSRHLRARIGRPQ
jgi:hypothetical protein